MISSSEPSWMGGEPALGETLVQGKTPAMARELLASAAVLGFDKTVVRTATHGFVVPSEVWDHAYEQLQAAEGLEF